MLARTRDPMPIALVSLLRGLAASVRHDLSLLQKGVGKVHTHERNANEKARAGAEKTKRVTVIERKDDGIKRPLPPGHYIDDTIPDIFNTDEDFDDFHRMLKKAKKEKDEK
jgi:hypothetical protein